MTVKVGDVLEVDQFLSDDPTQIVAEVCGNVMFLRPGRWNVSCGVKPYTIDPWPAKFLKPKPPESPDDVVHEFPHEFPAEFGPIKVTRDGRWRREDGRWIHSVWAAEVARLALALKEKA